MRRWVKLMVEALVTAAIIASLFMVYDNHEKTYLETKLAIMLTEMKNDIRENTRMDMLGFMTEQRTNAEWQHILKILVDSKRLTADQCFKLATVIQDGCKRARIGNDTFLGLLMTESELDSKCVFQGAKGIAQVMDITKLEAIGVTPSYDWRDPVKNTTACLLYFEYMRTLPKFKDSTDEMEICRAYNRGPFHNNLHDAKAMQYERKIKYYRAQF